MVRLVDDLLDVSRINRGQIILHKQRIDFKDVIGNAIERSSPVLEEKRHKRDISMPEGPVFLTADTTHLSQIVANLLHNVMKYTPPGGRIQLVVLP